MEKIINQEIQDKRFSFLDNNSKPNAEFKRQIDSGLPNIKMIEDIFPVSSESPYMN